MPTTETVHERIDRLQRECAERGWNGANMHPSGEGIHPNTAKVAHTVALALQGITTKGPFVGPSEEGELEFEWDADDGTYIVDVLFLPNEAAK